MNLIDFPDLILREIIKRLPPRDQLQIIRVCSRLHTVQQSIISAICKQKTSIRVDHFLESMPSSYRLGDVEFYQLDRPHDLHIRLGPPVVREDARPSVYPDTGLNPIILSKSEEELIVVSMANDYDFKIDHSNLSECSKTYSHITELTLVNLDTEPDSNFNLSSVFTSFSNLTRLHFMGIFDMDLLTENLVSLKSLKHLSVDLLVCELAQLDNVMTQLEHFDCRLDDLKNNYGALNDLIKKYPNIGSFGIWLEFSTSCRYPLSPEVTCKLTRLTIRQPFSLNCLEWITIHWTALTYLDFELSLSEPLRAQCTNPNTVCAHYPTLQAVIEEVLRKLSRLPYLTHLRMNLIGQFGLDDIPEALPSDTVARLPSLKRVSFQMKGTTHYASLAVSMFPNAEHVDYLIPDYHMEAALQHRGLACSADCQTVNRLIDQCGPESARQQTLLVNGKLLGEAQLKCFSN